MRTLHSLSDPIILESSAVVVFVLQVDCISTLDTVGCARRVGGQMHTDIRMCHDRCSQNYYCFLASPLLRTYYDHCCHLHSYNHSIVPQFLETEKSLALLYMSYIFSLVRSAQN